eukprot:6190095-Pleurochrysis_carterae.AAC.1
MTASVSCPLSGMRVRCHGSYSFASSPHNSNAQNYRMHALLAELWQNVQAYTPAKRSKGCL